MPIQTSASTSSASTTGNDGLPSPGTVLGHSNIPDGAILDFGESRVIGPLDPTDSSNYKDVPCKLTIVGDQGKEDQPPMEVLSYWTFRIDPQNTRRGCDTLNDIRGGRKYDLVTSRYLVREKYGWYLPDSVETPRALPDSSNHREGDSPEARAPRRYTVSQVQFGCQVSEESKSQGAAGRNGPLAGQEMTDDQEERGFEEK